MVAETDILCCNVVRILSESYPNLEAVCNGEGKPCWRYFQVISMGLRLRTTDIIHHNPVIFQQDFRGVREFELCHPTLGIDAAFMVKSPLKMTEHFCGNALVFQAR